MKKTNIFYWVFTGLFAFLMLGSAIPDIMSHPVAIQGMHVELGYPKFFVPFIGVAKLLGVIAILVPGFHKIKEWAYAGLFFDLIGATYSITCHWQTRLDVYDIAIGLGYCFICILSKKKEIAGSPC